MERQESSHVRAVLDANVLFPFHLRDLLIRLALGGFYRAFWSASILDEALSALKKRRPEIDPHRLEQSFRRMREVLREAMVRPRAEALESPDLPDSGDRHVLAAAFEARAAIIVTWNLSDFPESVLGPLGVVALDPDRFVERLFLERPWTFLEVLREQVEPLRSPRLTVEDLLDRLERDGLHRSVLAIRGARNRFFLADEVPESGQ